MNDKPLISVIISTYQRAALLPRAINSVLAQTFAEFELIIVDDASTDGTGDIVGSFKDKRILYIKHAVSKGGPASRNSGLQISCGKYIAFLDDDDEWLPDKLLKQISKFANTGPRTGVIYCWSNLIDPSGKKTAMTGPKKYGDAYYELLWGSLFGSVSKALIRRECFEQAGGFNENLTSCQDWDMWLRIALYYDFDFVPEILCNIYLHPGQLSNDFTSIIPGRIAMVQVHFNEFNEYPHILVQHYKQIGKLYALSGSLKNGWTWFKKAFSLRKFEFLKIILWLSIELPFLKIFSKYKKFKKQGSL